MIFNQCLCLSFALTTFYGIRYVIYQEKKKKKKKEITYHTQILLHTHTHTYIYKNTYTSVSVYVCMYLSIYFIYFLICKRKSINTNKESGRQWPIKSSYEHLIKLNTSTTKKKDKYEPIRNLLFCLDTTVLYVLHFHQICHDPQRMKNLKMNKFLNNFYCNLFLI